MIDVVTLRNEQVRIYKRDFNGTQLCYVTKFAESGFYYMFLKLYIWELF